MDERVFAGTIEVEAVVRVLDGGDRQPAPSQGGQQRGDQRRFSRPAAPDKSDHSHGQARVEGVREGEASLPAGAPGVAPALRFLGQTADFGAVKTSTVTAGPVYFSTSPTIEWPQALAELGRADVHAQIVDVAVLAQGSRLAGLERIIPAALVDPDHARTHRLRHLGASENLAAIVEHAHDVGVADPARGRVLRIDPVDMAKHYIIPAYERVGLSRVEAAEYVEISPVLFDQMVKDGRMPPPKLINSRKVWMRAKVEKAFAELPNDGDDPGSSNPWKDCA